MRAYVVRLSRSLLIDGDRTILVEHERWMNVFVLLSSAKRRRGFGKLTGNFKIKTCVEINLVCECTQKESKKQDARQN